MKNKFLMGTLSLLLLAGVADIVYAPTTARPDISQKEMSRLEKSITINPEIGRREKKIEETFESFYERQARFDSDPLYREVVSAYGEAKTGISFPAYFTPEFFRAVAKVESTDSRYAVSYKGAKGIMQMMPAAWEDAGKTNYHKDVFKPGDNIRASIGYFAWIDNALSSSYPGWSNLSDFEKLELDSEAYNFGVSNILNGVQLPEETRDYFPKLIKTEKEMFPVAGSLTLPSKSASDF